MISRKEYEDAELVMELGEELFHDENDYRFTDDEILGPIAELHCVTALPHPPERLMGGEPADPLLIPMQQQRYQQVVRSTLVLSLTALISQVSLKKAF